MKTIVKGKRKLSVGQTEKDTQPLDKRIKSLDEEDDDEKKTTKQIHQGHASHTHQTPTDGQVQSTPSKQGGYGGTAGPPIPIIKFKAGEITRQLNEEEKKMVLHFDYFKALVCDPFQESSQDEIFLEFPIQHVQVHFNVLEALLIFLKYALRKIQEKEKKEEAKEKKLEITENSMSESEDEEDEQSESMSESESEDEKDSKKEKGSLLKILEKTQKKEKKIKLSADDLLAELQIGLMGFDLKDASNYALAQILDYIGELELFSKYFKQCISFAKNETKDINNCFWVLYGVNDLDEFEKLRPYFTYLLFKEPTQSMSLKQILHEQIETVMKCFGKVQKASDLFLLDPYKIKDEKSLPFQFHFDYREHVLSSENQWLFESLPDQYYKVGQKVLAPWLEVQDRFSRWTGGLLDGLDWENTYLTGQFIAHLIEAKIDEKTHSRLELDLCTTDLERILQFFEDKAEKQKCAIRFAILDQRICIFLQGASRIVNVYPSKEENTLCFFPFRKLFNTGQTHLMWCWRKDRVYGLPCAFKALQEKTSLFFRQHNTNVHGLKYHHVAQACDLGYKICIPFSENGIIWQFTTVKQAIDSFHSPCFGMYPTLEELSTIYIKNANAHVNSLPEYTNDLLWTCEIARLMFVLMEQVFKQYPRYGFHINEDKTISIDGFIDMRRTLPLQLMALKKMGWDVFKIITPELSFSLGMQKGICFPDLEEDKQCISFKKWLIESNKRVTKKKKSHQWIQGLKTGDYLVQKIHAWIYNQQEGEHAMKKNYHLSVCGKQTRAYVGLTLPLQADCISEIEIRGLYIT